MGRMFGTGAGDKIRAVAAGLGMLRKGPHPAAQQDDSGVDALCWDLSEAGVMVVLYTGNRIAVTDALDHEYDEAVRIARAMIAERGLSVTVLDSPL